MSSSRSAIVTQSVRSFVRPYPFFSFSVLGALSSPKEFQKVLRVFEVSRVFQGSFKKVSRMSQGSFKGVSWKLQVCLKEV